MELTVVKADYAKTAIIRWLKNMRDTENETFSNLSEKNKSRSHKVQKQNDKTQHFYQIGWPNLKNLIVFLRTSYTNHYKELFF